jgi:hypothetical protein
MDTPEAKTETAPKPSGVAEAFTQFKQDQATAAAKKVEAEAAAKAAPEKKPEAASPEAEGTEAAKAVAETTVSKKLRFADESGKDVPFRFKADGKEIEETDPDKVTKYAELGYHASQRLEELNKREELLRQREAVIDTVDQAMKDGRLIVKGLNDTKPPAEEKKAEEAETVYTDPEIKKLKEEQAQMKADLERTQQIAVKEAIDKTLTELKTGIAEAKKEFPYAREKDVWDLLAQTDEKTGKPLHDVKSAMALSHKEMTEFFESLPLTEKQRQGVVSTYVADKAKAEVAPVGAPAGTAPGAPGGAKATEPKKITGITDALEQYKRDREAEGKSPQF